MRSCLIAALLSCAAAGASAQSTLTPEQWRQDLRTLSTQLPERHRDAYHSMSREQFEKAVAALDGRIGTLSRQQIILEMARIVAMVEDGHTNIAPTRDPNIAFHSCPVAMYWFDDGLYIRAASQRFASLVGAKVRRIGKLTADQAYAAVYPYIGRDNPQNVRYFAPHWLAMPEVLQALGIGDSLERVTLEVEQDGRIRTVELADPGAADMMPPDTDMSFMPKPGWVDARQVPAPLWLQDAASKHRVAWLADEKILYVQLNQVNDEPHETLAQFGERVLHQAQTHAVDKRVLDLRLNRGGNGSLNPPFVAALIKALQVDRPGHLFALIGRSTYSAAQFLANDLERYTQVVMVGEPTGGRPNSYGDSRKITLPNSGITVRASTLWWQVDERDKRQWIAPQVSAGMRFDDYRAGRDPALDAVRTYRPATPLGELLGAPGGSVPQRYAQWKSQAVNRYADPSPELQRGAAALLAQKRHAEAIEACGLWSALDPDDAIALDALATAYKAAGDMAKARAAWERAARADPKLASSMDVPRKLRELP
jgi:hypothetical protein